MRTIITSILFFISLPALGLPETIDVNINNPRVDGDYFKFDIQIKRTDEWSTIFAGIGNCDFYFHKNNQVFSGEPFLSDTNLQIRNRAQNYDLLAQLTSEQIQVKLSWIQSSPFSVWNPPIEVYEDLCTVVWEIANPAGSTGVVWDSINSGFNDVEGDIITPSYLGNGNIVLTNLLLLSEKQTPTSYKLYQNYPNPFNPTTRIRFDIPLLKNGQQEVNLIIYNSLGQVVRRLYSGEIGAGSFEVEWNGRSDAGNSIPSGIYFVVFKSGYYSEIRRVILLR